jgi:hypothetical protein
MPIFWCFMSLVNQSQLCNQSYTVCFGAGHRLAGKGPLNFSSVRGLNAYKHKTWSSLDKKVRYDLGGSQKLPSLNRMIVIPQRVRIRTTRARVFQAY